MTQIQALSGNEDIDFVEDLVFHEEYDEETLIELSALLEELETATAQLTSLPDNLYDAEKNALFGPDYNFTTIDSLSVSPDFNLEQALQETNKHLDQFENLALDYIENPDKYEADEEFYGASVLSELSGNKIIESPEKRKAYFEHLELIKSIDISSINESNALELISKIGYSTVNMLQGRSLTSI